MDYVSRNLIKYFKEMSLAYSASFLNGWVPQACMDGWVPWACMDYWVPWFRRCTLTFLVNVTKHSKVEGRKDSFNLWFQRGSWVMAGKLWRSSALLSKLEARQREISVFDSWCAFVPLFSEFPDYGKKTLVSLKSPATFSLYFFCFEDLETLFYNKY